MLQESQTILATFNAQPKGTMRQYAYGNIPSDYPQALKSDGVTYYPTMTICRNDGDIGFITIQAVKSSGEPHAIIGYSMTSQTFWGSVL